MSDRRRVLFPVVQKSEPSGGRKFIYQMVNMLNDCRYDAYVVHPVRGYKLRWFDSGNRVVYCVDLFPNYKQKRGLTWVRRKIYENNFFARWFMPGDLSESIIIDDGDIVVIPETRISILDDYPAGPAKIILNQGPYLFYMQQEAHLARLRELVDQKKVVGFIATSEHCRELQTFGFGDDAINNVRLFVGPPFEYSADKSLTVSYMPRRGREDATVIINMLRLRNVVTGVEFVEIDNRPEAEVADILKRSIVFLSLGRREGFGLPSAEAMLCGCVVVGYVAGGGREFFDPRFSFEVAEGDLMDFVLKVENILSQYSVDPESVLKLGEMASKAIGKKYSLTESKASVEKAFAQIFEKLD